MANGTIPVRRAVSKLVRAGGNAPQELVDYANGIKKMRALGDDNLSSLFYQAAIHGKTGQLDSRHPDWDWCQHESWFFFPWHRMYLVEFERIICQLIGKPDWRLPYWDYTADSSQLSSARWNIPTEFLVPADQAANPLFVPGRIRTQLGQKDREWEKEMRPTNFATQSGGPVAISFGGGRITTPLSHGAGNTGQIEGQPHNTIHRTIGGLMGDPLTAGLDPIFWLHHANIDRLWEVWRKQANTSNPTDAAWLKTDFTFPTASGGHEKLKISGVLDTISLGYVYDDLTPPTAVVRPMVRRAAAPRLPAEAAIGQEPKPELIGATGDGPVPLNAGTTVTVGLEPAHTWGLARRLVGGAGVEPMHRDQIAAAATEAAFEGDVFLQLENVKGSEPAVGVYDIFINIPDGEEARNHPELSAGLFATFGLEAASEQGHGMTQAFDITDVARHLYNEGRWDPGNVKVTLTAHAMIEKRDPAAHNVTVDRISVYVVPTG